MSGLRNQSKYVKYSPFKDLSKLGNIKKNVCSRTVEQVTRFDRVKKRNLLHKNKTLIHSIFILTTSFKFTSDFSHHRHHHPQHGDTTNGHHHGPGHGTHHTTAKAGPHGIKQNSKFKNIFKINSKQTPTHPSLDGFNLEGSSNPTPTNSLDTEINQIDQSGDVRSKRNIVFSGNGKIESNKNHEKLTIVHGIVEDITKKHPK